MPYMHWRFAGYAALAMSLTFSPQGRADDGPWVGKCVIVKSADVKIRYVDENRREQDDFAPTTAAYTVQQEKGQSVLIRDGGVSGWLAKKDALLAENASEYFTDRIRNNPIDADAYGRRAVARFEAGCLDMVIEDLDDAIRLDPNAAMWRRGRGIVWRLKGDYAKALADLDEAVRLEPKNADPLIERGIVFFRKQDYDKAFADYDKATRLDPTSSRSWCGRGCIWASMRQYDSAISDFNESIRLDPLSAEAFYNRGNLWWEKNQPEKGHSRLRCGHNA